MKKDTLVRLCRSLPQATEDLKWGNVLVFSVGGKMFACFDINSDKQVSFKASPPMFSLLTAKERIVPAPYLARHDWVLVQDLKTLSSVMLKELLRESYQIVAAKLLRKVFQFSTERTLHQLVRKTETPPCIYRVTLYALRITFHVLHLTSKPKDTHATLHDHHDIHS
jgi:predicted DNA-binding protein (MmcQ/YjbR family)